MLGSRSLAASTFPVVDQFEFRWHLRSSMASSCVAVLQAERRIPRHDAVCHGRSLGPLVKTRALRDDALRDSELSFPTTIFPASLTAILIPPKMNFRVQYSYDRTDHLALPH